MLVIAWVLFAFLFGLSGCATLTGAEITSEEEKQARVLLRAEAEAFQRAQQKRINDPATRLRKASGAEVPLKVIHVGRSE